MSINSNKDKPTLKINHKDLIRCSENSIFRSDCPICQMGVLATERDLSTGYILPKDHCFYCGQHFYYQDIRTDVFGLEYKPHRIDYRLIDWLKNVK